MRLAHVVSVSLSMAFLAATVAPTDAQTRSAPCAWEVEYELAARLKLSDTPLGAGDGIYPVGPGTVVLRFAGDGEVTMRRYEMRELFTIHSKALAWKTIVDTDTHTAATPDENGVVAAGRIDASHTVRWRTPVRGYHTEGTLTCRGSLCGKFGAPPAGKSAFRVPSGPVRFQSFVFAADMQTFTMATTPVAKTSSPKQSDEIALSGRERRRACVP